VPALRSFGHPAAADLGASPILFRCGSRTTCARGCPPTRPRSGRAGRPPNVHAMLRSFMACCRICPKHAPMRNGGSDVGGAFRVFPLRHPVGSGRRLKRAVEHAAAVCSSLGVFVPRRTGRHRCGRRSRSRVLSSIRSAGLDGREGRGEENVKGLADRMEGFPLVSLL
jgi:hypothetical protein